MKLIPLTQGYFAIVDDEDYDFLMQWEWSLRRQPNSNYASRSDNGNSIAMHRVIMKTPINMVVDHIDHNGLNCMKSNMRNCTASQNAMNRRPRNKRIFKGTCQRESQKWASYIRINGKTIHVGMFETRVEAAKAYDEAAKKYFGDFAYLNFPENEIQDFTSLCSDPDFKIKSKKYIKRENLNEIINSFLHFVKQRKHVKL